MARKKSAAKRAKEAQAKGAAPDEAQPKVKEVRVVEPEELGSEDSSSDEDEFGDLVTEDVEQGIHQVLSALKTDPKKLLDPTAKFFDDPENVKVEKKTAEKPIYLKDYHRMNILAGGDNDDNEYGTVDGEKPYVVEQKEEKDQLLKDIHGAFSDDDDEDDFLKKKEPTVQKEDKVVLPDPEKDSSAFLEAFIDNQAWIPRKNDKVVDLDHIDKDDEDDFENAVEDFEKAYNFRYEDENAAEIVSYARNQATLRRSKTNSRKKAREKKIQHKHDEENEVQELLKKKKTQKIHQVMDRLAKIREAVGSEVSEDTIHKVFGDLLLADDFDDADWDAKMAEIFNEQYYGDENEKPTWDEDDEIMGEFYNDEAEGQDDAEGEGAEEAEAETTAPTPKPSKKDKLKEKKSSKKAKEALKEAALKLVEQNATKLLDQVEEERGRSKEQDDVVFKYREVSPESFGLTTREILLADDKQLNEFIGIKKFAPYRPKEKVMKDKRKYAKKKHLNEWRKQVFRSKEGPKLHEGQKENEIWIPVDEPAPKRPKK